MIFILEYFGKVELTIYLNTAVAANAYNPQATSQAPPYGAYPAAPPPAYSAPPPTGGVYPPRY